MLLPDPADAIGKGIESVVGVAVSGGAPMPPWVAVDDGSDRWIALVAASSRAERARGVVAASSDRALVTAHRLGIGGAFGLPPSSLGAFEALTAASEAIAPHAPASPEVVGIFDESGSLHVVTVANHAFWCCQLGEQVLTEILAELACRLKVPPVILPWPALVIEGSGFDRAREQWQDLRSKHGAPMPDLAVASAEMSGNTALARAYAAVLAEEGQVDAKVRSAPGPVNELPVGGPVGWWAPGATRTAGPGWLATPTEVTATRCSWRVEGKGVRGTVKEVVATHEVNDARGVIAVRVSGWLVDRLRPGSPAGLLVTNIAEAAARRGIPLWIPNVDAEGLQMALRLPGTLWVDGPAVPRSQ